MLVVELMADVLCDLLLIAVFHVQCCFNGHWCLNSGKPRHGKLHAMPNLWSDLVIVLCPVAAIFSVVESNDCTTTRDISGQSFGGVCWTLIMPFVFLLRCRGMAG